MPGSGASGGTYGELLITSIVVLAVVCVLAFVVVRLARKYLGAPRGPAAGLLDVIARVPLEPRRSLYVVEVAGKALLVGTSEMGLTVLSELDRDAVRATPQVVRPSFVELVQAAWARRRGRPRVGPPAAPPSPEHAQELEPPA